MIEMAMMAFVGNATDTARSTKNAPVNTTETIVECVKALENDAPLLNHESWPINRVGLSPCVDIHPTIDS